MAKARTAKIIIFPGHWKNSEDPDFAMSLRPQTLNRHGKPMKQSAKILKFKTTRLPLPNPDAKPRSGQ